MIANSEQLRIKTELRAEAPESTIGATTKVAPAQTSEQMCIRGFRTQAKKVTGERRGWRSARSSTDLCCQTNRQTGGRYPGAVRHTLGSESVQNSAREGEAHLQYCPMLGRLQAESADSGAAAESETLGLEDAAAIINFHGLWPAGPAARVGNGEILGSVSPDT